MEMLTSWIAVGWMMFLLVMIMMVIVVVDDDTVVNSDDDDGSDNLTSHDIAFLSLSYTTCSQTFNVSGPHIWNGLPEDVLAPTLSSFRRRLKPFLFQQSYVGTYTVRGP